MITIHYRHNIPKLKMIFHKENLNGVYAIEPELSRDYRGYFTRTFCENEFKKARIDFKIVQINRSFTEKKGVIRGLHYQKEPKAEDKVVQCLQGKIYDVVVDLRKDSPTFGKWFGAELGEENKKMLLVPKGFAHGFETLTDSCLIEYYVSEFYAKELTAGIRWDDTFFGIKWPIPIPTLLSDQDKEWPLITSINDVRN